MIATMMGACLLAALPIPAEPEGPVITGAVSSRLSTVTVIVCWLTLLSASLASTVTR